jgi:hypothetical protein
MTTVDTTNILTAREKRECKPDSDDLIASHRSDRHSIDRFILGTIHDALIVRDATRIIFTHD